LYKQ